MFESRVVASILTLSLVVGGGAARACPVEQSANSVARGCGVSLVGAASVQSAETVPVTSSFREMFTRSSTAPSRERAGLQFSLRAASPDRSLDGAAPAGWAQAFAAPEAWKVDWAEPSLRSPLAWRQEAEDILRRESIADLAAQSAAAAALAHLPGQFGATGAIEALKRQDVERWRQIGAWSAKSGFELDAAPTKDTLFYMKSFYSAASQKTQAEAKVGVAVFDSSFWGAAPQGKVYVGPFAVADGLRRDQLSKIGAHLTLSEIGAFHVTLASGVSQDRLKGRGAFGLIETSWKF